MKIAIVKYNAGNTQSVINALGRLGVESVITDDAESLRGADRVIFPGVGEASSAMNHLRERQLDDVIRSLQQPVLGICLGMQLLCNFSEENDTNCLGILPYRVCRFSDGDLKVPQIGWNNIRALSSALFDGIAEDSFVYFVHGYYVEKGAETIATVDYGVEFSAAVQHQNFYAVQFHAEKSGAVGAKILENFLKINV
ncbi:MAG TPA: imidazole glycerol phosphate synthase subunit HisH [Pyrinomonadaceae bacterium]|jgi:glutamine amidotransferase|nr:imidazole glycerol phosphate synthase subunit HisH [Pyrinomonadaceae bacterium]